MQTLEKWAESVQFAQSQSQVVSIKGLRSLLLGSTLLASVERVERSTARVFRDGVVVNILNPKTAVFFLAFVPQFVDEDAVRPTMLTLVLGLMFVGWGLVTDGLYALGAGWIGRQLETSSTFTRRKDIVAGMCYLGLGAATFVIG